VSRTSTDSSSLRNPRDPTHPAVPEDPAAVRATLDRLGLVPSKRLGQSFLANPFVADAEAALVEVPPGRPVLEIGGGLGILTAALLRRGIGPITVMERDPRLAAFLREALSGRVTVVEGDALRAPLPRADCVVGNLPYSAATAILLRLFAARVPRVVFLVQREVAERLASGPGSKEYGRLSLIAQLYGTVELYRTVAANAFIPPPQVESRLATHVARPDSLPVPSVPEFERIVRILFASRRKQLRNLLPRLAPNSEVADRLAEASGWPSDWKRLRPEALAPSAFFALARAMSDRGL
jgi:16S rRNA (adenine1518-N6/adenine1519-N6)-dimethyltransferase